MGMCVKDFLYFAKLIRAAPFHGLNSGLNEKERGNQALGSLLEHFLSFEGACD